MALALAAGTVGAQAMYKWVDEKGVTHFSATPPPDGHKASKVMPKVVPPSRPPRPEDPESWREKDLEFRKRQILRDRQEAAESRALTARERDCAKKRRRLAMYEEQRRIFRRDEAGNRVYLSEEERERSLEAQRREVQEKCR